MITLKEDEVHIAHLERSYRAYLGSFIFAAALASAAFLMLFWLLQFQTIGLASFAGMLVVALALFLRALIHRAKNILVITDQRVIDIDKKGLFHKTISEMTHDMIEDVSVTQKGLFASLLNIGTLTIIGMHGKMTLVLTRVANPITVQETIMDVREAFVDHKRGVHKVIIADHEREDHLTEQIKKLTLKELLRHKKRVDIRLEQFMRAKTKKQQS